MLHTQKNFWEHPLIISPCCSILLFDIRLQIPGIVFPACGRQGTILVLVSPHAPLHALDAEVSEGIVIHVIVRHSNASLCSL